jgi:hypothetical protein
MISCRGTEALHVNHRRVSRTRDHGMKHFFAEAVAAGRSCLRAARRSRWKATRLWRSCIRPRIGERRGLWQKFSAMN